MRIPERFLGRCWAVFVPRNWTLENQGGPGVDATRLAMAAGRGARGAEARLSRAGPEHTLLGRPEADEAANAGCRQGRRESRSRIEAIGVRRRDRTEMGKNPRVPEARGGACDHHQP